MEPDDNYPQQLCSNCWEKCKNWAAFEALAKKSDRELKRASDKEVAKNFVNVTEAWDWTEQISRIKKEKEEEHFLEGYSLAPEEEVESALPSTLEADNNQRNEQIPMKSLENHDKFKCYSSQRNEFVHTNERPFSCEKCEKAFQTIWNLQAHQLTHSSFRPFKCNQCPKKFKSKSVLKQHKLIHSEMKEFECDQCEKKFRRKGGLKQHKLMHSEIKEFECPECVKKFKSKSGLNQHKLIHGIAKFGCETFVRKSELISHQKSNSKMKTLCDFKLKYWSA